MRRQIKDRRQNARASRYGKVVEDGDTSKVETSVGGGERMFRKGERERVEGEDAFIRGYAPLYRLLRGTGDQ